MAKDSTIAVPLSDAAGADIGVTVDLAVGGGAVEERMKGWSTLVIDGEPYLFSKARAAALLARFPHFRDQLERAGK